MLITNLLERPFLEEHRRLKIIPNAFREKAVLKLMFGTMIRAAERWRSIGVTEFERRQMAAVRKELDEIYEAENGLGKPASKETSPIQIIQQVSDLTRRAGSSALCQSSPPDEGFCKAPSSGSKSWRVNYRANRAAPSSRLATQKLDRENDLGFGKAAGLQPIQDRSCSARAHLISW